MKIYNEIQRVLLTILVSWCVYVLSLFFLDMFWELLEKMFDGGVTNSISDTIIGSLFLISLYYNFKNYVDDKVKFVVNKTMELYGYFDK